MLGRGPVAIKSRRGRWFAGLLLGIAVHLSGAATPTRTILVMGDSLSAGYGMRITQSWVALLEQRLRREGYGYAVINASVSGETSAGGRARFPHALALHRPSIVILELGANDALRGLPIPALRANLDAMIALAQQAGAKVLLLGMRVPPNYSEQYSRAFYETYAQLATKHRLRRVDFFLDKVALTPGLLQDDQLHPTVQAQPLLLENVWPQLLPLLDNSMVPAKTGGR